MNNLFEYTKEEIESFSLVIPNENEIDAILEEFVNSQIESVSNSGSNTVPGPGGMCTCLQNAAYDILGCGSPTC